MADDRASRLARWTALCRFAISRAGRQLRTAPRQTAAMVGIIGLTIALLLIVTGIGVALAEEPSTGDDADIRVVPEQGGTLSAVVEVEGPRLSNVHERTAPIDDREDVDYATPVLAEVVEMRTVDGDRVTVIALGIVPSDDAPTVAGLPTTALEPGDPHYADGAYDGPQTGDIVLSAAAADQLEASADDPLFVRSPRTGAVSQSHDVAAVEETDATGAPGELPVVAVRLSELQTLTGADDDDLADQVLVKSDSSDAETALEETYPDATIDTTETDGVSSLADDDLALATSLVALVVGLTVCSLFVATATALTVERERRTLAVLAAVGFSSRSRLAIISLTTLVFVLAGGVLGLGLGVVGIGIVNAIATATIAPAPIATVQPVFALYGLAVAVAAGLLAMPYPLALAARTNVIDELNQ